MRMKQVLVGMLTCVSACGSGSQSSDEVAQQEQATRLKQAPIGLSLFFSNAQAAPLQLLGDAPRYLQEIDILESASSSSDDGITPLLMSSALSALDWSGVEQVEEIWVPSLDGSFTRERYYRNARWMELPSTFRVVAVDHNNQPLGPPLLSHAGGDDELTPGDDQFVRRFVARQSALGCASVGDCNGATFVSQVLVQARGALDPDKDARVIPASATKLRLAWSQLPGKSYEVPLEHLPLGSKPFDYGFNVSLEPVTGPANGAYYAPGETVSFRVSFKDGQGNRLHPEGQLPSYGAFFAGQVESGLRYLDLQMQTRLYYALKHRESNLLAVVSGPTHKLRTPQTVVDPTLFFAPQVPFATVAVDGFTAVGQTVPPAGIVFGGFADPSLWSLPVSDVISFTIPVDAEPGTYVAAIKARRDYAGEALNRGDTVDIQVGQTTTTHFTPKTTCTSCHAEERTRFDTILHGLGDRRACFGCHSSLGIEFDNALDIRVHTIHSRSDRVAFDVTNCGTCHLAAPSGPARGL